MTNKWIEMSQLSIPAKSIHNNIDFLSIWPLKGYHIASPPLTFDRLPYFTHINHSKITFEENISHFFPQFDLFLVDVEDATMGLCLFEVLAKDGLLEFEV